ncbi:MarR family transcriptional regulator [Celeribacter sp. ULVN23_4]
MTQPYTEGETPFTSVLGDLKYVDRSLAVACTRGREAVVSRFRQMLRRANLSEQQWRVLRILFDEDARHKRQMLTSADIAEKSCIHKVSISRIIRSLEDRGLISRSAHDVDGRANYVQLTAKGRAELEPLVAEATLIHNQIARDFGFENYAKLLDLLHKLASL